uniref:Uncharacterized protein n=1 Tax=Candidatus Kentrum sp. LFY TaxID=2126342 RepID=A0A450U9G9_9GAMM|nr:MAG: hypothetical protein BECKLFY1418A_GA0070994_100519 [Candidatus Kentron sp. LFY]
MLRGDGDGFGVLAEGGAEGLHLLEKVFWPEGFGRDGFDRGGGDIQSGFGLGGSGALWVLILRTQPASEATLFLGSALLVERHQAFQQSLFGVKLIIRFLRPQGD